MCLLPTYIAWLRVYINKPDFTRFLRPKRCKTIEIIN